MAPSLSRAVFALLGVHASALVDSSDFFVATGRAFSFLSPPGDSTVTAYGKNTYGQLGINSKNVSKAGAAVILPENATDIVDIACGAFHTLFLTMDGVVYGAGRNNFGQLGNSTSSDSMLPFEMMSGVKAVAAGYGHSLFLMEASGSVRAVGLNNQGQLGDGTRVSRNAPMLVDRPEADQIAAGYDFSLWALQTVVKGAGNNMGGQLGDTTRVSPVKSTTTNVANLKRIVAGEAHTLFLAGDGTSGNKVLATGANFNGQLGFGNNNLLTQVTEVDWATSEEVGAIAAGGDSSCVLSKRDGNGVTFGAAVKCAGSNFDGQLGLCKTDGTCPLPIVPAPQEIEDFNGFSMSISDSHSLVVRGDFSDVASAGSNSFGELGLNSAEANIFRFANLNLGISTTVKYPPAPTPAPTPSPTPAPAPSPEPGSDTTREGLGDDRNPGLGMETLAYILFGVLGAGVIVFAVVRTLMVQEEADEDFGEMQMMENQQQ